MPNSLFWFTMHYMCISKFYVYNVHCTCTTISQFYMLCMCVHLVGKCYKHIFCVLCGLITIVNCFFSTRDRDPSKKSTKLYVSFDRHYCLFSFYFLLLYLKSEKKENETIMSIQWYIHSFDLIKQKIPVLWQKVSLILELYGKRYWSILSLDISKNFAFSSGSGFARQNVTDLDPDPHPQYSQRN